MKQINLLLLAILVSASAKSQLNITNNQFSNEVCFAASIQFTVSPYDPAYTYEWYHRTYDNWSQNPTFGNPLFGIGQTVTYLPSSYTHGTTLIQVFKKNQSGTVVDYRAVNFFYYPDVIPYYIDSAHCNSIIVPVDYGGWVGPPYATWYKDGVVAPQSWGENYSSPTTGNYQFKLHNNGCGIDITTPIISIVNTFPTAPTVTASGPLAFCPGSSVNLSVPVFSSYQWYRNNLSLSGAIANNYTVTDTAGYKVRVTNSSGCSATSTVVSTTYLESAKITAPDTIKCTGDSVILTCNPASSYAWNKNGVPIPGAASQTYKVTQPGSYQVVTSGLPCNNTSNTISISFVTAPTVTVAAGGPLSIHGGTGVSLTASATNASTYKWYRNNVLISGQVTTTLFANLAGTYKCGASNAECEVKSAGKAVTVISGNQLPTKTLTLQPDSAAGKDTYVNSQAIGTGNFGSSGSMYAVNIASFEYRRSLVRFDLSSILPGTIINTAKLNLYADLDNFNLPVNSTFLDPLTGPWNEFTATWGNQPGYTDYNRLSIAGSAAASMDLLNLNVKGAVVCMVNNPSLNNGWRLWLQNEATTAGRLSLATSDHVNTSRRPKLVVNYAYAKITAVGSLNICDGKQATFYTNTGPYTYQWKKNGIVIPGEINDTLKASVSGNYSVVLTDPGGCTVESVQKTLTVNPLPAATVTPLGPVSFCAGDSVVLSANTGPGLTYQWKKNGINIAGAVLSNYTAKTAGTYKTTVTDVNGCTKSSSNIVVTVPCRISADLLAKAIRVMPNPSHDYFILEAPGFENTGMVCTIYGIQGNSISSFMLNSSTGYQFGSDLKPGCYYIEIKTNDFRKRLLLVKQ